MALIIFRSILIFLVLLVILRLMGKRQIGEMQPFELVITLIIADLACIPMTDVSIPLVYGIVSIFSIFLLHQILTLISGRSERFNRLLSGSPCLVIDENGLRLADLKKLSLSVSDLLEIVRSAGYCGFEEIRYAIMETSGNLSVVASERNSPKKSFSELVISDGKLNAEALQRFGMRTDKLFDALRDYGEPSLKKIAVCTLNEDGDLYIQSAAAPKRILRRPR